MKTIPSPSYSINLRNEIANGDGMSREIVITAGEKEFATALTIKVLTAFFSKI